jgi:hypothetical protein
MKIKNKKVKSNFFPTFIFVSIFGKKNVGGRARYSARKKIAVVLRT